jgi:phosphoribosylaminoimidazole-succinocarboxamide synthase
MDETTLRRGLELTLERTELAGLGERRAGKVRDSYVDATAGRRTIVVTDRISAFDYVLGTVPFKGQVLNGMAAYWFEESRGVAANHLLGVPDPAVSVVRECTPFAVEMVVRGYLTGSSSTSIWTHYARGARDYCGHVLPEGMRKHERLPRPLITPTTKAELGAHDEPLSAAQVVERGICSAADWEQLAQLALRMFDLGTRRAAERGLILVDTKYELGRDPAGEILFIDEIHTPDSSRYWYADSYEDALRSGGDPRALDKEFVRRRLVADGYDGKGSPPALTDEIRLEAARRYVELFERVTGRTFVPDLQPPAERIRRNLGPAKRS